MILVVESTVSDKSGVPWKVESCEISSVYVTPLPCEKSEDGQL